MPDLTTPVLRPFLPLRSCRSLIHIPDPRHPPHVWKKRSRLQMFPFILRLRQPSSAQFARLRLMRKPLLQRLRQLKQCARILEQARKDVPKDLGQLQSTFANLARQVHHIRVAAADYEIIESAPFDGYTYIWTWKSIIIRFCGSNSYFRIIFDFTRYISPACAEYALVVY
jgi:hypothetical protein